MFRFKTKAPTAKAPQDMDDSELLDSILKIAKRRETFDNANKAVSVALTGAIVVGIAVAAYAAPALLAANFLIAAGQLALGVVAATGLVIAAVATEVKVADYFRSKWEDDARVIVAERDRREAERQANMRPKTALENISTTAREARLIFNAAMGTIFRNQPPSPAPARRPAPRP